MDGRWKRLLAGGVLCGAIGCSHTPKPSVNTGEPPLGRVSSKDDKRKDNAPIKVETLLALANVRVEAAADVNRTSAERENLQNQARLFLQQVLQREPKNLEAMLGMARLYQTQQDRDKTVEWYQRAAKAYPANGDLLMEMGTAMTKVFKDRDMAIHCFHAATKVDPDNKTYRKALGFALAHAGRYEEGYAWLSRCMPHAEAHYNLARMMDHNGHHEQANQHFALAVQANPNHELAKMGLSGSPAEETIPEAKVIQSVKYEQFAPLAQPLPIPTPPPAAPERLEPLPKPVALPVVTPLPKPVPPPTAIQAPEPLPLYFGRDR